MISRKKFKHYIEFLKNYAKKLDDADVSLHKISSEFTSVSGIASPVIEQYIYMLTDLIELTKIDNDLLWRWIYDMDFGEKTSEIKTPEDLYDYIIILIKESKKKQEKKNGKKVS